MKRKLNYRRIFIVLILFLLLIIVVCFFFFRPNKNKMLTMPSFVGKDMEEVQKFAHENQLKLEIDEVYDQKVEKGKIISQVIVEGTVLKAGDMVSICVSLGKIDSSLYAKYQVNEVGRVPIMMYHGIHSLKNEDTNYIGGNVDYDGYQRTAEAFRNDLEYYYQEGYRMVHLNDYVHGKIDVELGKSPIVLTFDDGLSNNVLVTGVDDEGNILIDPNSAVGILEEFKKKYPDFQVTATFFVNGDLFQQDRYNEQIVKWLVNHGYDVGNHSYSHANFTEIDGAYVQEEIGSVYQMLERIIPGKYVTIVALPFGSPYALDHENFGYILNGSYDGVAYHSEAALRVGWESDYSPFSKTFNSSFLKRIRAYDNNGEDFDIQMNFNNLKSSRYISDGDVNTIVVPTDDAVYVRDDVTQKVITY